MQPGESADRMARTTGTAAADQAERDGYLTTVASVLAGRIASGDEGAVRRFIHELEHGISPWRNVNVDPWRLAEHLAVAAIRRTSAPAERPDQHA